MTNTTETVLRRTLFDVFGERDASKRRATIAGIWADDDLFVDPQARLVGHEAVN